MQSTLLRKTQVKALIGEREKVRGELPLQLLISFYLSFWMSTEIGVSGAWE